MARTMEKKVEADRKMMERLGTDHDEDIWALIKAHKQVRREEDGPAIPWYQTNPELDEELQQGFAVTLVPWEEPVLEKSAKVFSAVERLGLTVPFQLPVNEASPYSVRMIKEIMHFNHVKKLWDLDNSETFRIVTALEARSCWREVTIEDIGAALWLWTEGALPHVVYRTYPRAKIRHLFKTPSDRALDQKRATCLVSSLIDDKLKILLPAVTAFFVPAADYGCLERLPNWVFAYVMDGLAGKQTNLALIVHGMFVSCCERLQTDPDGMKMLTRLAPLLFPIYARKGWLSFLEFEWYVKARTRSRQLLREKKVECEWQMILSSLKPPVDIEPEQLAGKRGELRNSSQQASREVLEQQSTPVVRLLKCPRRPRTSAGRAMVGGASTRKAWPREQPGEKPSATSKWQGRLRSLTRQRAGGGSAREAQKSPLAASGKRGRSQDLERLEEAVKRRKERARKTTQEGEDFEYLSEMLMKSSACQTSQSTLEDTSRVPKQKQRTKVGVADMLDAPRNNKQQTEADTCAGQRNEHESADLALVPTSVHPDILGQQNIGNHAESVSIQPGSLGALVQQVEDHLTLNTACAKIGTLGSHRAETGAEIQLESASPQPDTSKVPENMLRVMNQSYTAFACVQLGTLDTLGVQVAGDQLDTASAPPGTLRGRRVKDLLDSASAQPVLGTLGVQRDENQADYSTFAPAGWAGTLGGQRAGSQQELPSAQPDTSRAQRFPGDLEDSASRSAFGTETRYEAMRHDIASNLMSARDIQHSLSEAGRNFMEKATDAAERSMTAIDNVEKMETEWIADKEKLKNEVSMWRSKADIMLKIIGRMKSLESQVNDLEHCLGNAKTERDRWIVFRELFPTKMAAENLIKERDDIQDRLSNTVKALGIEECKVMYLRKCFEEMKVEQDTWTVFQDLFPSKAAAENLIKEREELIDRLANTEMVLGEEETKNANLQHEIRILRAELMRARSASARKGVD